VGLWFGSPSDTIKTRLLESDLLVAHVQCGRVTSKFSGTTKILEELVDQGASLDLRRGPPRLVAVEVCEQSGDVVGMLCDVVRTCLAVIDSENS
jgi:hypothetical protein